MGNRKDRRLWLRGNVRFWLIADIRLGCDLRPLYPRKQTLKLPPFYESMT